MAGTTQWESECKSSPEPKTNEPRCLAEGIVPWMAGSVEWIEIDLIKVNRKALRKHKSKKVRRLAASIREFGFAIPILIDGQNDLISGDARLAAAILLDMDVIPVIRISHLTKTQLRVFHIADNRLGERAEWDEEELALELQALLELQVNIELTGFEVPEVDLIIENHLPKTYDNALDDCPQAPPEEEAISRRGDVWLCGPHRVLCGDARNRDDMLKLMNGTTAQAVFTDSPYNLKIEGFVSGKGKIRHKDFDEACGEMSDGEFTEFCADFLRNASAVLDDGALIYCFIDWRHIDLLITAGKSIFDRILNICVWTKTNAGMGSFYRSRHEFVIVFKKGTGPFRNNVELGQYGRNRSNVWEYEGANSINPARRKELALHPTVKPVRLVADALLDCTKQDDIVLDPFLGSGTTLIAAEDCRRRAYGIEIDPKYVDVIINRWQELTGDEATLESLGQTLNHIREQGRTALLLSPPILDDKDAYHG